MELIVVVSYGFMVVFFFNDTATTEIYTLSLHDALPIYYGEFRQRVEDLIGAQYTTDPEVLLGAIATYDIDFWLLDRTAFQPDTVANSSWLRQYEPLTSTAVQPLRQGTVPILQQATAVCTTFETETLIVLAADCVADWVGEVGDRPL